MIIISASPMLRTSAWSGVEYHAAERLHRPDRQQASKDNPDGHGHDAASKRGPEDAHRVRAERDAEHQLGAPARDVVRCHPEESNRAEHDCKECECSEGRGQQSASRRVLETRRRPPPSDVPGTPGASSRAGPPLRAQPRSRRRPDGCFARRRCWNSRAPAATTGTRWALGLHRAHGA